MPTVLRAKIQRLWRALSLRRASKGFSVPAVLACRANFSPASFGVREGQKVTTLPRRPLCVMAPEISGARFQRAAAVSLVCLGTHGLVFGVITSPAVAASPPPPVATPSTAVSGPPSPQLEPVSPIQRAIALGAKARDDYAARRYKTALRGFAEAESLAHSPQFVLHMARCERELGGWVAAWEHYRAVVEEKLAADAPGPFIQAQHAAAAEGAALDRRIPRLRVIARSPLVTVELDGTVIWLNSALRVDPGQHELVAHRGGLSAARTIIVAPDEQLTVEAPLPMPVVPSRSPAALEPWADATSLGLWIAGGAALVVGAVAGSYVWFNRRDCEQDCSSLKVLASVADIGVVGGGALLLGGAAVRVWGPRITADPSESSLGTEATWQF